MQEYWKSVVGYEGYYEVSNLGRVRSCDRKIIKNDGVIQNRKGRLASLRENSDGYLTVKLSKNGNSKTVFVHRLVAKSFVFNDDMEHKNEVNHLDFNRRNNSSANLAWCTHRENVLHSSNRGHYSHFGASNSNFRGKKLKNYYRKNPEKKCDLVRLGAQNGRAVPIRAIFSDGNWRDFSYLGECGEFVKKKYGLKGRVRGICDSITTSIRKGKPYCNMFFERI